MLFSSFLIFSSIYRSWFDFSKYLYAGGVIFYCYSDQNSDKISIHNIEDYKWFFTFSEQQKIKINIQRHLVLSLCIKPLRDNAMVDKKGNATSLKVRMIYRPLPFCCKRIKHKKIKLIIGTIHILRHHIFGIFGPPSPLCQHVFSTKNKQKLAFYDPPLPLQVLT